MNCNQSMVLSDNYLMEQSIPPPQIYNNPYQDNINCSNNYNLYSSNDKSNSGFPISQTILNSRPKYQLPDHYNISGKFIGDPNYIYSDKIPEIPRPSKYKDFNFIQCYYTDYIYGIPLQYIMRKQYYNSTFINSDNISIKNNRQFPCQHLSRQDFSIELNPIELDNESQNKYSLQNVDNKEIEDLSINYSKNNTQSLIISSIDDTFLNFGKSYNLEGNREKSMTDNEKFDLVQKDCQSNEKSSNTNEEFSDETISVDNISEYEHWSSPEETYVVSPVQKTKYNRRNTHKTDSLKNSDIEVSEKNKFQSEKSKSHVSDPNEKQTLHRNTSNKTAWNSIDQKSSAISSSKMKKNPTPLLKISIKPNEHTTKSAWNHKPAWDKKCENILGSSNSPKQAKLSYSDVLSPTKKLTKYKERDFPINSKSFKFLRYQQNTPNSNSQKADNSPKSLVKTNSIINSNSSVNQKSKQDTISNEFTQKNHSPIEDLNLNNNTSKIETIHTSPKSNGESEVVDSPTPVEAASLTFRKRKNKKFKKIVTPNKNQENNSMHCEDGHKEIPSPVRKILIAPSSPITYANMTRKHSLLSPPINPLPISPPINKKVIEKPIDCHTRKNSAKNEIHLAMTKVKKLENTVGRVVNQITITNDLGQTIRLSTERKTRSLSRPRTVTTITDCTTSHPHIVKAPTHYQSEHITAHKPIHKPRPKSRALVITHPVTSAQIKADPKPEPFVPPPPPPPPTPPPPPGFPAALVVSLGCRLQPETNLPPPTEASNSRYQTQVKKVKIDSRTRPKMELIDYAINVRGPKRIEPERVKHPLSLALDARLREIRSQQKPTSVLSPLVNPDMHYSEAVAKGMSSPKYESNGRHIINEITDDSSSSVNSYNDDITRMDIGHLRRSSKTLDMQSDSDYRISRRSHIITQPTTRTKSSERLRPSTPLMRRHQSKPREIKRNNIITESNIKDDEKNMVAELDKLEILARNKMDDIELSELMKDKNDVGENDLEREDNEDLVNNTDAEVKINTENNPDKITDKKSPIACSDQKLSIPRKPVAAPRKLKLINTLSPKKWSNAPTGDLLSEKAAPVKPRILLVPSRPKVVIPKPKLRSKMKYSTLVSQEKAIINKKAAKPLQDITQISDIGKSINKETEQPKNELSIECCEDYLEKRSFTKQSAISTSKSNSLLDIPITLIDSKDEINDVIGGKLKQKLDYQLPDTDTTVYLEDSTRKENIVKSTSSVHSTKQKHLSSPSLPIVITDKIKPSQHAPTSSLINDEIEEELDSNPIQRTSTPPLSIRSDDKSNISESEILQDESKVIIVQEDNGNDKECSPNGKSESRPLNNSSTNPNITSNTTGADEQVYNDPNDNCPQDGNHEPNDNMVNNISSIF